MSFRYLNYVGFYASTLTRAKRFVRAKRFASINTKRGPTAELLQEQCETDRDSHTLCRVLQEALQSTTTTGATAAATAGATTGLTAPVVQLFAMVVGGQPWKGSSPLAKAAIKASNRSHQSVEWGHGKATINKSASLL
jgi:hypothetical protein